MFELEFLRFGGNHSEPEVVHRISVFSREKSEAIDEARDIFNAIKARVDASGFRIVSEGRIVARRFYGKG